ncbi:rubredoxin [Pseudomonas promysalinigenes]|uniref:rubredoxin n=1 Tax=Pseudomonas promysalinigenes TaxID=485898 RepID=UPI00300E50FB
MTTRIASYYCETCWYVYDPIRGDPEHGIEPGTAFEDIPQRWRCPDCGLGKEAFVSQERQAPAS